MAHNMSFCLLTLLFDMEFESSFEGRGRRSSFTLSKPEKKVKNKENVDAHFAATHQNSLEDSD